MKTRDKQAPGDEGSGGQRATRGNLAVTGGDDPVIVPL
jgi:hypothetical protein